MLSPRSVQRFYGPLSLSQPVDQFNANPSFRCLCLAITSCPAFQQTPPFRKNKFGFFPPKCPVTGVHGNMPVCAGWGVRVFLRVDGDDFTATASHQEGPVQTLEKNLQELHVVFISSSVPWRSRHVEQNQMSSL